MGLPPAHAKTISDMRTPESRRWLSRFFAVRARKTQTIGGCVVDRDVPPPVKSYPMAMKPLAGFPPPDHLYVIMTCWVDHLKHGLMRHHQGSNGGCFLNTQGEE